MNLNTGAELWKVYSVRKDRLGTRVEALLSTWRFARKLDRLACVFWPKAKKNYHYYWFFDLHALEHSRATRTLRIVPTKRHIPAGTVDLPTVNGWPCQLRYELLSKISAHLNAGSAMDLRFEAENPSEVLLQKRELFESLPWHPDIQKRLVEALRWIGKDEFAAVHIRRGDVVCRIRACIEDFLRRFGNCIPSAEEIVIFEVALTKLVNFFTARITDDRSYFQALARINTSNLRVVFFGDSDISEFKARIPDFDSLDMSSFHSGLAPEQTACLEMLLLCHATLLISTQSHFSKVARHYGRPLFHDARSERREAGTKDAFEALVGDLLAQSDSVRELCTNILNRHIARDPVLNAC